MGSTLPLTPDQVEQLLNGPAAAPPPNTVPNLENPHNENRLAIAVIATCLALATVFSVLRVFSRVFCVRKVRLEDCKYFDVNSPEPR